jgi:hypothetical protein
MHKRIVQNRQRSCLFTLTNQRGEQRTRLVLSRTLLTTFAGMRAARPAEFHACPYLFCLP